MHPLQCSCNLLRPASMAPCQATTHSHSNGLSKSTVLTENTSHVAEDVSCLVQKAPSRCSTQIGEPHQMPILRPKDCHTTNQKYRPRLRFEAIEDTPSALICTVHAFSKKSLGQASGHLTSLSSYSRHQSQVHGLGRYLKFFVLTNKAALTRNSTLNRMRSHSRPHVPRDINGRTLSCPSPSATMRVQRRPSPKRADYRRVPRFAGRTVPVDITGGGRQEKSSNLCKC